MSLTKSSTKNPNPNARKIVVEYKEKTIREWFESIPDREIRVRALLRTQEYIGNNKANNICMSPVVLAFNWAKTPEGHTFWQAIHNTFDACINNKRSLRTKNFGYNMFSMLIPDEAIRKCISTSADNNSVQRKIKSKPAPKANREKLKELIIKLTKENE